MALGLPSEPAGDLSKEEYEEAPDEYCPRCGWDSSEVQLDPQSAFNAGVLLAVEEADGSPFTSMGATQLLAWYMPGSGYEVRRRQATA
jgi:hypothetical protein